MERGVVTAHGPDDGDERHKNGNSRREIGSIVNIRPHFLGRVEAGESFGSSIRVGGDEDDDDDKGDDVERASVAVKLGDPLGGHTGDEALKDHDESGKEESLVIGWHVGWIIDADRRENHGCHSVIDGRCPGDLTKPVRPTCHPGGERAIARWSENGTGVVKSPGCRHR